MLREDKMKAQTQRGDVKWVGTGLNRITLHFLVLEYLLRFLDF